MTSSADPRATVGIVRRPHGVRGEITVESRFDGDPAWFVGKELSTRRPGEGGAGPPVRVVSARRHGDRWLLGFEGVTSPEAARLLGGLALEARVADLPAADPDHPYHFELVGLEVVDGAGRSLGRVCAIEENPAGDLLALDDERTVLIPFRAMVRSIDRERGILTVEIPEGLLDVNRPRRP